MHATRLSDAGATGTVGSAASAQVTVASLLSLTAQSSRNLPGVPSIQVPCLRAADTGSSYTVHVDAQGTPPNTVANTTVQTTLPPYVNFVSAQTGSGITYDTASRTVTWSLGDVKAGVGYTSAAEQASFR